MRQSFLLMPLAACCMVHSSDSFAQTERDTFSQSGQDSFAQSVRGTPAATSGSTTEQNLGGVTTQSLDAGIPGRDSAGPAGGNATGEFVGSSGFEGFVGSAREPTTNSALSRLFREITEEDVTTGGTQESSGDPRRVPVTLRLGFAPPLPQNAAATPGPSRISLDRFHAIRPDLSDVRISVADSGVATLAGLVSKPSSSRLASNLIRLRPGIKRIRNQIEIRASGATSR